jgi:hypothetical protein
MLEKLKKRWDIKSNVDLVLILLVFSLSGFSILFVTNPIFSWLGIDADTSMVLKTTLRILLIIPIYQLLLLIYGFLFGQFGFFWEKEKRMIRWIGKIMGIV